MFLLRIAQWLCDGFISGWYSDYLVLECSHWSGEHIDYGLQSCLISDSRVLARRNLLLRNPFFRSNLGLVSIANTFK